MPSSINLAVNKCKRLLELLFYLPLDSVALALSPRKTPNPDTVAIVHVKLLGDYILWLPYGQLLANHFKAGNLRVVLVVNEQLLSMARRHFPSCTIIGISRTRFLREVSYRVALLKQLATVSPLKTYHDTSPRETLIGDAIVRALGAPATGFAAVHQDRTILDSALHRRLYSCLIPECKNSHQNIRHLAFAKSAGAPINLLAPAEHFADESTAAPEYGPYIAIAPGGSRDLRRWPASHFAALARRILERYPDCKIVVLGTQSEAELGERIASELGRESVRNMAGKTDMESLVLWIRHARLLLGNDSGAGHIAAACGTKSLIIVGGGHYGRCFPYDPKEAHVRQLPATVTHRMDCFGCDWLCRYRVTPGEPVPCIAGISIDAAQEVAEELLESPHDITHH